MEQHNDQESFHFEGNRKNKSQSRQTFSFGQQKAVHFENNYLQNQEIIKQRNQTFKEKIEIQQSSEQPQGLCFISPQNQLQVNFNSQSQLNELSQQNIFDQDDSPSFAKQILNSKMQIQTQNNEEQKCQKNIKKLTNPYNEKGKIIRESSPNLRQFQMHSISEASQINQSRDINEDSEEEENVMPSKLTENLFTGYTNASTHMRSMTKPNKAFLDEQIKNFGPACCACAPKQIFKQAQKIIQEPLNENSFTVGKKQNKKKQKKQKKGVNLDYIKQKSILEDLISQNLNITPPKDFSVLENIDLNESKYYDDEEQTSIIENIFIKNNGEQVRLKSDYYNRNDFSDLQQQEEMYPCFGTVYKQQSYNTLETEIDIKNSVSNHSNFQDNSKLPEFLIMEKTQDDKFKEFLELKKKLTDTEIDRKDDETNNCLDMSNQYHLDQYSVRRINSLQNEFNIPKSQSEQPLPTFNKENQKSIRKMNSIKLENRDIFKRNQNFAENIIQRNEEIDKILLLNSQDVPISQFSDFTGSSCENIRRCSKKSISDSQIIAQIQQDNMNNVQIDGNFLPIQNDNDFQLQKLSNFEENDDFQNFEKLQINQPDNQHQANKKFSNNSFSQISSQIKNQLQNIEERKFQTQIDQNQRDNTSQKKQKQIIQRMLIREVQISDFEIDKKLGQGAYGKVYLAKLKGTQYAIKKLSKEFLIKTKKGKSVFRERDLLINNQNFQFLPKLHHTFIDEKNLYFVMEYIQGGTLQDLIKIQGNQGFEQCAVQFFSAQIVLVIEYLQKQNVAHRDIKPENIMLDQNNYIKLIDFGEAKIVDNFEQSQNGAKSSNSNSSDGQSSFFGKVIKNKQNRNKKGTFVGTPYYQAPEMLNSNKSGLYTDLWAFGCIIYEMSSGKKMFRGRSIQEVFDKILDSQYEFPQQMNAETKDIIQALTNLNPQKRLGLKNIQALKSHQFFEGIDFDKLKQQYILPPSISKPIKNHIDNEGINQNLDQEKQNSNEQDIQFIDLIQDHKLFMDKTIDQEQIESKILQLQEQFKVKVKKHGVIKRQQGILFKQFKEFELYLLENGMMIFYSIQSKQVVNNLIIQLEDNLRIDNVYDVKSKKTQNDQIIQRFTLKIGNKSTNFEVLKSDGWLDTLVNFNFQLR